MNSDEKRLADLEARYVELLDRARETAERTLRTYGTALDNNDLMARRLNGMLDYLLPDKEDRLKFEIEWAEFMLSEQEKLWQKMLLDPGHSGRAPSGLHLPNNGL